LLVLKVSYLFSQLYFVSASYPTLSILAATPHDDSVDHAVFRLASPSQDGEEQDLQVLMERGLEVDLQLLISNLHS